MVQLRRIPLAFALGALLTAGSPFAADTVPLRVPPPQSMPSGPLGADVQRGLSLVNATQANLPGNVGNGLNCASCHLNGGTVAYAAPLAGLWGVFPEFNARNARVELLPDRINDCFERSMNGKALPVDGPDMRAILAYIAWLSTGVPTGTSVEGRGFLAVGAAPSPPDRARGAKVFAERCEACHGADGAGKREGAGYTIPPLWGPASFNAGAGMARIETAASFVRFKMPMGRGGTLSVQEAYDVAAFFTQQPRPAYTRKN
jgi:thiosulfate dehydrogenase